MENLEHFFPLFEESRKVPFQDYLSLILESLPEEKRKMLLFERVSYTRGNDGLETLLATFYLKQFCNEEGEDEEDRWINAAVLCYGTQLLKDFCANDHISHDTLEQCIDQYLAPSL